jgi:ATP-binding cassette subfamily B (MDR/TAP) protein 1
MVCSGFTIAFTLGWSLALAMLLVMPIILSGMIVYMTNMGKASIRGLQSYGQSAGYAEQALSAIKLVTAFGMQETESETYQSFLKLAKSDGIR